MSYVLLTYVWLHKVQYRHLHMNYKKRDMPGRLPQNHQNGNTVGCTLQSL